MISKNKEFLIKLRNFLMFFKSKNDAVYTYEFINGLDELIENYLIVPKKNIKNNIHFKTENVKWLSDGYLMLNANFKLATSVYIEKNKKELMEVAKTNLIQEFYNKFEDDEKVN